MRDDAVSGEGSARDGGPSPVTAALRKTRTQRLRWPLMSLAVVAVVGGGAYFYFTGGRYQSTDDAYAQAATVSISANVAGRVSEIDVRDNEFVHRGAISCFKLAVGRATEGPRPNVTEGAG